MWCTLCFCCLCCWCCCLFAVDVHLYYMEGLAPAAAGKGYVCGWGDGECMQRFQALRQFAEMSCYMMIMYWGASFQG